MANQFSSLNLAKVRQLRPFKIDYSRVRNLEYVDKHNLPPQAFAEYRQLVPLAAIVTEVPSGTVPESWATSRMLSLIPATLGLAVREMPYAVGVG